MKISLNLTRFLQALTVLGGAAVLAGIFLAPERAWGSLLLVSFFLICLGLAGVFFVALNYACGAGWATSLRRIPESMVAAIPFGAVGLIVVFLFGRSIYPWTHEALAGFKHLWLNYPLFLTRAGVYFIIWTLFAITITTASRAQDRTGSVSYTYRNVRLSIAFLVFFSLTFWLASYDWIMSLEPDWSSTIFGVYNFAGLFSSGLAMIILLALWLRRGPLRDFINEEHLHDLGKLLFAFTTFWMYIWFSQYMLIWYADMSEETSYFVRRQQGTWQPLFLLNMFLNWAVPFLLLLPKGTKRNPKTLARVAIIVLMGRWLDLYLMILPSVTKGAPPVGIWEIAPMAGAVGLFLLLFVRRINQAAPVPLRDPYLGESLHYHN